MLLLDLFSQRKEAGSGFEVQFLGCFLSFLCIFYLAIIKAKVAPTGYSMVPTLPGLFIE